MNENYRTIEDFENYEVSTLGNVRNKKTNRILKPLLSNGYQAVVLNSKFRFYIHRLVAKAFVDNIENKPLVDHIDNNTQNNNFLNLRWVNKFENQMNRSLNKNNTSGYKGIYFSNHHNKWRARIRFMNQCISLGLFKTAEEASMARLDKARELFGEFINPCEFKIANLNLIIPQNVILNLNIIPN
jgi:hypothetical protein